MSSSPRGLASIDPLSRLLEEAGVHRDSVIRVTGAHGLAALIWLCRHGFDQVGYLRPEGLPAMAEAQVLLVAGPCEPQVLDSLLDHGPRLCDGGLMIVQTPRPTLGDANAAHRVFRRHGMVVVRRLPRHDRELWLARRPQGQVEHAA